MTISPKLREMRELERRGGFTMVEVIVAMVILTVGVLGLAGTTGLIVRQITLSDMSTDRSAALQTVLERIRSLPFDSVADGSQTMGDYSLSWTSTDGGAKDKLVTVVTSGPGLSGEGGFPTLKQSVVDTFEYRIIE